MKGATNFLKIKNENEKVSIHAPVKGATAPCGRPWQRGGCFNPRTREGCDYGDVVGVEDIKKVSIHAPVKGATMTRSSSKPSPTCFNPRTREGCDTPSLAPC